MKFKTFDNFLEIRVSIVTKTNYINSIEKVEGYILNHFQLILPYVCESKCYFNLDNFLTNNVAESAKCCN